MREVELKAVVDDLALRRVKVERAGAKQVFVGRLVDRRYDSAHGGLMARDHVLRLRVYERDGKREGHLDWKGETHYENGYKVRDEISTSVGDPDVLASILSNLGMRIVREIEREIAQYSLGDTTIRFERYPRMDDLVEVEGTPEGIEKAIVVLGIHRDAFTSGRLADFVMSFEQRTGQRAAVSSRELRGEYLFSDSAI